MEERNCLFCGSADGSSPFINKLARRGGMGVWSIHCFESICCLLFGIPTTSLDNNPIYTAIENSNCCSKCRQVVQDVDFTLRLLNQLLQRLEKLQQNLLDLVKGNSDRLSIHYGDGSMDAYKELVQVVSQKFSTRSENVNAGIDGLKNLLNLSRLQSQQAKSSNNHDVESIIQSYSPEIVDEFSVKTEPNDDEADESCDDNDNHVDQDPDWDDDDDDHYSAAEKSDGDDDNEDMDISEDSDYEDPLILKKKTRKRPKLTTKDFKCSECSSRFSIRDNLQAHCRKVHENDPKPYHCSLCSQKFRQPKSLKRHLLKGHKNPDEEEDTSSNDSVNLTRANNQEEKKFKCPGCPLRFVSKDTLRAHIRKISKNDPRPYHCRKCSKKFKGAKGLKFHTLAAHLNDPLTVENDHSDSDDDDIFKDITDHSKPTLPKNFKCLLCNARCISEDSLSVHRRGVHEHDPKPYHCNLCSKKFGQSRSLIDHIKSNKHVDSNAEDEVKHTCELCSKDFASEISLQKHRQIHHNQPMHFCNFCNLNFKSLEEKETHEENHKSSDLPFQCLICLVTLSNSHQLKQHVAAAHSSKQMVCDVCGIKFSSNVSLRKHRQIHQESFVGFPCPVCGHVFRQKSNLSQHMHKHTNKKVFMCDVCGKGFNYPAGLKRHHASHDPTDLSCECKICGKVFLDRSGLVRHEEIHSGTLSYECRTCQKKFKTKNSLAQHERIHRPKDPNKIPRIRRRRKQEVLSEEEEEEEVEDEESQVMRGNQIPIQFKPEQFW